MNNSISTNKTLINYPDILDARMVAEYLSIGYVKALSLIKYSGIPYKKIGNVYRIHKRIFENWLLEPKSESIKLAQ